MPPLPRIYGGEFRPTHPTARQPVCRHVPTRRTNLKPARPRSALRRCQRLCTNSSNDPSRPIVVHTTTRLSHVCRSAGGRTARPRLSAASDQLLDRRISCRSCRARDVTALSAGRQTSSDRRAPQAVAASARARHDARRLSTVVSFRPLFLLARSAETNRARHPPFGESQIERCLPTPELGRAQRRLNARASPRCQKDASDRAFGTQSRGSPTERVLQGPSEERFERQPGRSVSERTDSDETAVSVTFYGRRESHLVESLSLTVGALDAGCTVVVGIDPKVSTFDRPHGEPIRSPDRPGFRRQRRVRHQVSPGISRIYTGAR